MTRSFHQFSCESEILAGSLDSGPKSQGLLIVGGGNEIRSGAHAGMARLAQNLSGKGHPVFRYDRRGIGDSSGVNQEFLNSRADICAAIRYFRVCSPNVDKILAFGNCDAATSLALFTSDENIDGLALANPWVIETSQTETNAPAVPPPSAIRARYWERIKNPQTIVDLFAGRINLRKFLKGIRQATQKQENNELSLVLRDALQNLEKPGRILLASRDTTALAFMAAWSSQDYQSVRDKANIALRSIDTASHSFADASSRSWLEEQLLKMLQSL